jgi:hypothetical protein
MGLPIQKAPKHRCKLSDGTEVTFRPFLVKEQKYLLLARDGNNSVEILNAVREIIKQVTEGKVDSNKLNMFDLEYLFLQIRTKSVGETQEVTLRCEIPDCDGTGSTTVDLSKVGLDIIDGDKVDNTIQLTDTLGVTLRFPTAMQLAEVEDIEDEGDKLVHLLQYGIHTIYDEETVYDTDDIQTSELVEFVENLTLEQVDKLNTFFEHIPTLKHDLEYKCDGCGHEQTTTLKGLQSFF